MYFPTNWGAKESQNLPNHRVVMDVWFRSFSFLFLGDNPVGSRFLNLAGCNLSFLQKETLKKTSQSTGFPVVFGTAPRY